MTRIEVAGEDIAAADRDDADLIGVTLADAVPRLVDAQDAQLLVGQPRMLLRRLITAIELLRATYARELSGLMTTSPVRPPIGIFPMTVGAGAQ